MSLPTVEEMQAWAKRHTCPHVERERMYTGERNTVMQCIRCGEVTFVPVPAVAFGPRTVWESQYMPKVGELNPE